jgi:pilus assembly protein Flp/PilA
VSLRDNHGETSTIKQHPAADARTVRALLRDQGGLPAIEYGLIAALIAVAAVTVMGTVGTNLGTTFASVASAL